MQFDAYRPKLGVHLAPGNLIQQLLQQKFIRPILQRS